MILIQTARAEKGVYKRAGPSSSVRYGLLTRGVELQDWDTQREDGKKLISLKGKRPPLGKLFFINTEEEGKLGPHAPTGERHTPHRLAWGGVLRASHLTSSSAGTHTSAPTPHPQSPGKQRQEEAAGGKGARRGQCR